MLGAATTVAILSTLLTAGTVFMTGKKIEATNKTHDAYKNYYKDLESSGLGNYSVTEVLQEAYVNGRISEGEYKRGLKLTKSLESDRKEGKWTWDNVFWTLPETRKQTRELYSILRKEIPNIDNIVKNIGAQYSKDPDSFIKLYDDTVANMPAPNYLDENINAYQIEEDVPKIWTGKQLAELHDIGYDLNDYYDMVKEGTQANVAFGNYQNEYANNASMYEDTASQVSYLDSIRNAKEQAIASGTTAGNRYANELLATVNNANNYANNQLSVAQQKGETLADYLLADAQANITARKYMESLGQQFGALSNTLYTNDNERYGAQVLANADMYRAAAELAGNNAVANANMQAYYNTANAAANKQNSTYNWIFNNELKATNGDVAEAYRRFQNIIFNQNANENRSNFNSYYNRSN